MKRGPSAARVERWDEICRLIDLGLSQQEVSDRMGVSRRMVSRALEARRGYPLWHRAPWSEELTAKILEALEDGWSYREVMRTYGPNESDIAKRFPGYQWTAQQIGDYAYCVRRLNEICASHSMKLGRDRFASLRRAA